MAEFINWEAEEEEGFQGEEDMEVEEDLSDFMVNDNDVLYAEPYAYANPYLQQSLMLPRGLQEIVEKNSSRVS